MEPSLRMLMTLGGMAVVLIAVLAASLLSPVPFIAGQQVAVWNASAPVAKMPKCTVPTDGMNITEDTVFCPGVFSLPFGVIIGKDKVKLNCNGATLDGKYTGIRIQNVKNTNVKNCNLVNYSTGIELLSSSNTVIKANHLVNMTHLGIDIFGSSNNTLLGNSLQIVAGYAIFAQYSKNNVIKNNQFDAIEKAIIILYSSDLNAVTENTITKCQLGIIPEFGNNLFAGNTITNCSTAFAFGFTVTAPITENRFLYNDIRDNAVGIGMGIAFNNTFLGNNFVNNTNQVKIPLGFFNNTWSNASHGNFWSDFHLPSQGCYDSDLNTFCDAPYTVDSGNIDYLPSTLPL